MKADKLLCLLVFIILLLLDYAALDDITTGSEPSFWGEYLVLILSIPLMLFLIYKIIRGNNGTNYDKRIIEP